MIANVTKDSTIILSYSTTPNEAGDVTKKVIINEFTFVTKIAKLCCLIKK